MPWNYRLIKLQEEDEKAYYYYGVHSVYYDKKGNPEFMATNPVKLVIHLEIGDPDETEEDIREYMIGVLEKMLAGVRDKPVFEPPERWETFSQGYRRKNEEKKDD